MTTASLTRLVVLWLLSEQPHHGYRIRKILAEPSLREWFPIEDASIYSMLRSLVREGWARQAATRREGRRPRRTVFAITPAGRARYQELLRRAWRETRPATDPVQLALAASGDLPDDEVGRLAAERATALARRRDDIAATRSSAPAGAMVDRELARLDGERRWLAAWMKNEGGPAMPDPAPKIDLICNVVIRRADGDVLLSRSGEEDPRWWIPSRDLVPYEHPDEVAPKVVAEVGGLEAKRVTFTEVESFRGRSGWHVMFNYVADVTGSPRGKGTCEWFAPAKLPQMAHGSWEKQVIARALKKA